MGTGRAHVGVSRGCTLCPKWPAFKMTQQGSLWSLAAGFAELLLVWNNGCAPSAKLRLAEHFGRHQLAPRHCYWPVSEVGMLLF